MEESAKDDDDGRKTRAKASSSSTSITSKPAFSVRTNTPGKNKDTATRNLPAETRTTNTTSLRPLSNETRTTNTTSMRPSSAETGITNTKSTRPSSTETRTTNTSTRPSTTETKATNMTSTRPPSTEIGTTNATTTRPSSTETRATNVTSSRASLTETRTTNMASTKPSSNEIRGTNTASTRPSTETETTNTKSTRSLPTETRTNTTSTRPSSTETKTNTTSMRPSSTEIKTTNTTSTRPLSAETGSTNTPIRRSLSTETKATNTTSTGPLSTETGTTNTSIRRSLSTETKSTNTASTRPSSAETGTTITTKRPSMTEIGTNTTTKPSSTEKRATNMTSSRPLSTETRTTNTTSTRPSSTETRTTNTISTKPSLTEAGTTNTTSAKPSSTETRTTNTIITRPSSTETGATNTTIRRSLSTETKATNPASTRPSSTETGTTNATIRRSLSTETKASNMTTTRPSSSEAGTKNTTLTRSSSTETRTTNPTSTSPSSNETRTNSTSDSRLHSQKIKSYSQPLDREKALANAFSVRTVRRKDVGSSSANSSSQSRTSYDAGASPPNKSFSYSQPLDRDAFVLGSTSRLTALRKHSFDDDRFSVPVGPSEVSNNSFSYPPRPPQGQQVDYGGSFTLERAMSEQDKEPGKLPEFVAASGAVGIFKVPLRAPVHPGRPPALELRPHPLRETQVGTFLRTIVSSKSQIWAGEEAGVRVWEVEDLFKGWPVGNVGRVKRGDEESVPFRESGFTSPTLCMVVDSANELVWSGHKDGKIRSWSMRRNSETREGGSGNDGSLRSQQFRCGLSWQAHNKASVFSMAITSYGEIWTGSEGGVIRAWPWDAIQKSLSLSSSERHMAALLVEKSYVDLRAQVTVNGVCSLPPSYVKYMASDNSKSKVWTASSLSFALWDGRTRNLLKVFNIDGHVETKLEAATPSPSPSPSQEPQVEDEMKVKFVSSSKKEKSSLNFFQRSRNALLGAADAVRRAAVKGSVEDNRKTEAIVVSMDGTVWTGFTNGALAMWDGNGNRLQDIQHHNSSVQSFCTYGTRLWVGYASGVVQVFDLEGNLLGGWLAHNSPIIKMAVGDSFLFTLAHQGGIRGWHLESPGPLDDIMRMELTSRELSYTKEENIRILVGTWNVGQERASHDSLIAWLGSAASEAGLVIVGLQEVEMGAGFLAMAAAKETVGLEGSANGQWWLNNIGKILGEGTSFQRIGSRQLAGLLIAAWARKNLCLHIGDVDAAAVPCGFGRAIGNKGAVGLRMRVYDRVLCFVNCHFAAHLEAVNKRNADFDHVYKTMSFGRSTAGLHGVAAGATSVQLNRGVDAIASQSDDGKPDLSEVDMLVFLGDLNYRLHSITYDEARDMVSQRCFDWLRDKDQLRAEMKAGKVFQGMREAQIKFPPTYKFEKNQPGLSGYDSGEKKRIPAWCDRILYRDCRSISEANCSLECPVVATVILYEACMDVVDSDHKPVRCAFNVELARINRIIRRQEYGKIIASNQKIQSSLQALRVVPETTVSTNNIILQNKETSILRITNKSVTEKATFQILCESLCNVKESDTAPDQCTRCSFGFPFWLEVQPAVGIIKPSQTIEVAVHHHEFCTQEEFVDGIPQNWWCEDTRDKEVVLLINVSGTHSAVSNVHNIEVRHCFTTSSTCSSTKEPPRRNNSSRHPSSDMGPLNTPSEVGRGSAHMRIP